MSEQNPALRPREHGDRSAFLDRIRSRQGPPPTSGPHPPPPPPAVVPEMAYRSLDGIGPDDTDQLLEVFLRAARTAEATVDVVDRSGSADGTIPAEPLWEFVGMHAIRRAVASDEPEVAVVADAIRAAGVEIAPYTRERAAHADLAITSATHAIAATGSVVVDSVAAGSRAVSLLPRVHLCVVPVERIVPTPSQVLRTSPWPMPSCRVLVTGPSRTGDIEQLLTLGAHGPVALHLVVVR